MVFLGVLFDTVKMTMEITADRLQEILLLVDEWLVKEVASLKEVQQLLGKLNFVGACVKASRVYINRLLNWLREIYVVNSEINSHIIPSHVKQDLNWWKTFLPLYNGISVISTETWSTPDDIFSSDACLSCCGGYLQGHYFHAIFPTAIHNQNLHISALEMLSIVVCVHLWYMKFKNRRIVVQCDNMAVCLVLNSGKSKCQFMQKCLR